MDKDLESIYKEAQAALKAKDYARASELLRQILKADVDYKDAAQLLARVIKLSRRRWYNDPRLWGALGVLFLVGLGIYFFPKLQGLTTQPASVILPTDTLSPTIASPATATATLLPTPIPLTWKRIALGQEFPRDTITAIVFDPRDAEVIYVGTRDAGIYKSIDGGLSWQPKQNGLGRAVVYSLIIDKREPNILYAGTRLGGVYRTRDGGETWTALNTGLLPGWEVVGIVVMDPNDAQHLYYTQSDQVYETHDGGENWEIVHSGETCPNRIVGLVVSPKNGDTLVTSNLWINPGDCESGIYRSADGGKTWAAVVIFDDTKAWLDFALDRSGSGMLYAYSRYGQGDSVGLYRSLDIGETWQQLPAAGNWLCRAFALSPLNGLTAFCNDSFTLNGGDSWQVLPALNVGSESAIAVSPHSEQTIFIGGTGLWISSDGGNSSVERSNGLGALRLELYLDPTQPGALFVEDSNCITFESLDGGRAWESFFAPDCHNRFAKSSDGSMVYWTGDQYLYRSTDGGKTTTSMPMPLKIDRPETLIAHPVISGRIYALYFRETGSPYLFVSDDSGTTWRSTSGMESIGDGRLIFDHEQGRRVYAVGDSEIFRSDDAGETWITCAEIRSWPAQATSRLVVDPRNPDHLALATRGGGVLLSQDGCSTWAQSNIGLSSLFVNSIAIDLNDPDILYAGTDGGAYISFDGGQTWGQVNDGLLGATVVYSIAVDKDSNVYAATPYGIFKLEKK